MVNDNLENRLEKEAPSFLENLFDASGAAIGTGIATNALLGGATGYATLLAYLIPYGSFKAAKYLLKVTKNPLKNLSPGGIGAAIHDTLSNILPAKDKVPAGVGIVSGSTNYLGAGSRLINYLSYA